MSERRALYFDHNSSTPVDPRVLERFVETERAFPANPGSVHAGGRRARAALERAREAVAGLFGVDSGSVLFVSGGTEANNLAVSGLGDALRPVLLARTEHPSVIEPARRRGVEEWAVDGDGRAVVETPARPVGLVCLVHGQNELGTIQPVAAAAQVAAAHGVPLHVDAAQTLGRIPLDEVCRVATSVALSAHKVGGLRGSSVLICKDTQELRPLLTGGQQESGRRAGTPSPSLAAATALAFELAVRECAARAARSSAVTRSFVTALQDGLDDVRLLTPANSLPNTAMFVFDGVDGRNLLPALDLAGVQASQGSACSSGSPEPPPILGAIGLEHDAARRCVRFSFSHAQTIDDAEDGAARVVEVVGRLRRVARR